MSVVDASLLGAFNNEDEAGHEAAVAYISRANASASVMRAPTIVVAEVASAILRIGRTSEMASDFVSGLRAVLELHPVDLELAQRAAELVLELGLRGCDAIYVALAERFDEELVTLDRQQFERGGAIVQTVHP